MEHNEKKIEFALNEDEERKREALIAELEDAGDTLTAAVDTFNTQMKAAWEKVEEVQNLFNEKLHVAQSFVLQVHSKYAEVFDARSEDWKDSDEAESVTEWLLDWATQLDESDIEMPGLVEIFGLADEELDSLPNKPE